MYMGNMKVLVYGAKGWIGQQFVQLLDSYVEGMARADVVHQVREELDRVMPTHVISFIGRIDGVINGVTYSSDYLEHTGMLVENVRDNLAGPMILAKLCEERRIHFTYVGTGCIFNADNNHVRIGYKESDNPTYIESSYSIVKGYTDVLMKLYPVLQLRIHMPIAGMPHAHNCLTKVIGCHSSILNSMTVLPDVLPIIYDLMEKEYIGTLNLTNPGYISSNEIVEMYREIVDSEFVGIETVVGQCTMLDTTLLETMYCIPTIHESVRAMLYEYKQQIVG